MTTIKNEIKISGKCLMDGRESIVTVVPSDQKGIRFYPDNSDIKIEARAENVVSTLNCTILGNQDKQLRVVEHFMAACAFTGIDSLDVYVSSSELPILDGSAKVWVEEFQKAGIESTDSSARIEFYEPIIFSEGRTQIVLLPSDSFKVSYMVNFEHKDLANRWENWDISEETQRIVESRTFGYLKDLEKFQKAGFALGASIDNTVGLTEDGYTVELRNKFEPINHKILDLVGDLYLTGLNPLNFNAHIIAKEAGHRTHVEFAKKIQSMLREKV